MVSAAFHAATLEEDDWTMGSSTRPLGRILQASRRSVLVPLLVQAICQRPGGDVCSGRSDLQLPFRGVTALDARLLANGAGMKHIVVCVLTFKRPELLRSALSSLLEQEVEPGWTYVILVIDNDAGMSGRIVAEELSLSHPDRIRYVVEERQGIATARNRALAESASADFVAFIDDDERAEKRWLVELVRVQVATGADVVYGPVYREFDNAPDWVLRGNFFEPLNLPSGAPVRFVGAGNVLMKMSLGLQLQFDERFDRTGGEDTHYFEHARIRGARMVWAAEARAYEFTPSERTRVRWIVNRAKSAANRYTRTCMYLRPGLSTALARTAIGIGAIVQGAVLLPTLALGKHRGVQALCKIFRGFGTISGVCGAAHVYYSSADPMH